MTTSGTDTPWHSRKAHSAGQGKHLCLFAIAHSPVRWWCPMFYASFHDRHARLSRCIRPIRSWCWARAWRYNFFVSTCPRIPYDDLVTRGISGRLSHGRLIREDEEQNKLFENREVGIDRLADDLPLFLYQSPTQYTAICT